MTKQKIRCKPIAQEKYDDGPFLFDGSVDDVIAALVEARRSLPSEFLENATCEITSEGGWEGSYYPRIEISSWRWETDAEESDREASQRAAKEANDAAKRARQEAHDRAEFARLSAKFGQI